MCSFFGPLHLLFLAESFAHYFVHRRLHKPRRDRLTVVIFSFRSIKRLSAVEGCWLGVLEHPADADAPARPWANAPSPTPFSAVSLPVRGPRKNPPAGAPDASAHTSDGSADPKSRWLSPLPLRPHTLSSTFR